jgi:hypothetical protein
MNGTWTEPAQERTEVTTLSTLAVRRADEDKRKKKQDDSAARKRRKREKDAKCSPNIGIATECTPEKYAQFDAPEGTVSRRMAEYVRNLQENDCVARPQNWAEIIYCRKERVLRPPSQHPWQNLRSNHYCVAATHNDLEEYFKSGFSLPVLIVPESALGQDITGGCSWFQEPLANILDEVLKDPEATVQVQDHALAEIAEFTVSKRCDEVRNRFRLDPQQRGCPWNCLEIVDLLAGHKGPECLKNGAKLRDWQFTQPKLPNAGMERPQWSVTKGAKKLDQWLLLSEKDSVSTAHVDVGFATYISCMAGKKTIWLRNHPTAMDKEVWDRLDIDDNHRIFEEPWARLDLRPGCTM